MRTILSIAGMLVVMGAQAEVTKITPMLSAVKESKGKVVEMPAARRVAPAVRELESAATMQRLDSVVGFNSDGSKGTMMRFVYNENGWWTETHNYYWDAGTESWGEPVQSILVDRMENGYVLAESNIYSGYGVRSEYIYDDRNRGIVKTNYSMSPDEEGWVPTSKGEYTYDDNDNIIEEYVYSYDADSEEWVYVNHNYATWDAKGRQTSIDGNYWNGEDWERTMKLEYRWFDGPYDPDYIPGAEKERMTYRLEYMEIDGEWLPIFVTENFFNEDGRVSGQSHKYYNRENDNYYGGESYGGLLMLCTSWVSEIGYDEVGVQNLSKTFQYIPGKEERLELLGQCDYVREDMENGDFIMLETNRVNVYDSEWNVTGEKIVDKCWYAYNKSGKKLWCYEEMPDVNGVFIPMLEDKWAYDERNRQIATVSYDFNGNERVPADWVTMEYDDDDNLIDVLSRCNAGGGLTPLGVVAREAGKVTDRDYRVGEDDERENWKYSNHWQHVWENGQKIQSLCHRWDGESWMNSQGQNNYFDFSVAVEDMIVPPAYTDVYKVDSIERLYGYGEDWMSTREVYYYTEVVNTAVEGVEAEYGICYRDNTVYGNGGEAIAVTVYDLAGQKVMAAEGTEISLRSLAKGVYVVEAESASGVTRTIKVYVR